MPDAIDLDCIVGPPLECRNKVALHALEAGVASESSKPHCVIWRLVWNFWKWLFCDGLGGRYGGRECIDAAAGVRCAGGC